MSVYGYMLDTTIVSHLVNRPNGRMYTRLRDVGRNNTSISIVVASEIRFGLAMRQDPDLMERVSWLLAGMTIVPFQHPADEYYADIRYVLESTGLTIGANDLFIAAHARARDVTLVTANVREFGRVPGLLVENWLD
jgi:tRNA(fMet)-specific endonuclease VapC